GGAAVVGVIAEGAGGEDLGAWAALEDLDVGGDGAVEGGGARGFIDDEGGAKVAALHAAGAVEAIDGLLVAIEVEGGGVVVAVTVVGRGVGNQGEGIISAIAAVDGCAGADAVAAADDQAAALHGDGAGDVVVSGEPQVAAGELGEAGGAFDVTGEGVAVFL